MAKSLGLSTEEMSKLQVAARLSDTSTESLTTAMGHLEKGLGEIARGGGKEASDALADLGLNAQQLRSQSPYEALTEIAESIQRIQDPTRRTTDAMTLFGKGGRELIPMLLEGRAGMEAFANAAEETGNVISGMDATAVREAAEAVRMLDLQAQGMANTMVVAAAPAVVALSNELRELATSAGAARGGIGSDLSPAVVALAYVMQTGQIVGQDLSLALLDIAHAGTFVAGSITSLIDLVGGLALKLTLIGPLLKFFGGPDIVGGLDAMNDKVHEVSDTIATMHDDIAKQRDAAGNGGSIGDKFLSDTQAAAEQMKHAGAGARDTGTASAAAAQGVGAFADAMDGQGEATRKAVDHGKQLIETLREQIAVFGQTAAQAEITKAAMKGASPADLAGAMQLQGQLDSMKAAEATAKLTEKLREQVQWYGKTAEQVQYLKAQQDLAARGDIVNASKLYLLQNQLDELNANKKAMEDAKHAADELAGAQAKLMESADALARTHAALAAGSSTSVASEAARNAREMGELQKKLAEAHASAADAAAATGQLQANQAMEHSNKLLEEGAKLRESLLTPQQKLSEEVAHYSELLRAGAINQATYAAAVQKAQESIRDAISTTYDTKAFDPANFNFGALAQMGNPGQGLLGGHLNSDGTLTPFSNETSGKGGPDAGKAPPFGAPPVPPALADAKAKTDDLLQQIFDLLNGKMQTDLHTCAQNPPGLQ